MYPLSQMYKRAMDCSWLRLLKSCYHTHWHFAPLSYSQPTDFFFIHTEFSQTGSLTDTALITRNIVSYTCRKHIASCNIPEQTELELCCFLLLIAFWVFLSSNDVPCCCSPTIFGSSQNSCGLPIVIGTITIITKWISTTFRFQGPHSGIVCRGGGAEKVRAFSFHKNYTQTETRQCNDSTYQITWSSELYEGS